MKPHHYCVYIMASLSGTLYVGVTNNVWQRSWDHNLGEGSIFSKRYAVNRLVYYETFQYVNNAIAREKELKGWRRSKKMALIKGMNPGWLDLSVDFRNRFKPDSSVGVRRIPRSARNDK